MPFIRVSMSCALDEKQEIALKTGLGEIIEEIPGKSEPRLMLEFSPECRMWFAGKNDEKYAFVDVASLGVSDKATYQSFSDKTFLLLEEVCGISPKNIYIRVEDHSHWYAK